MAIMRPVFTHFLHHIYVLSYSYSQLKCYYCTGEKWYFSQIRNNKKNRQYIFATHNANIPVFGDAELIIGLVEEDGQGKINGQAIGSIDNKQVMNQVVNILEGGETAFKIRKEKYQF